MRDYSKVGPRFWTGETGKYLRRLGRDAQVIGFYLFTCPNSNMLGLYYLPLPTLCHETGIDMETSRAVLDQLSRQDPSKPLARPFEGVFARYDEVSETVFVTEMARHQIGEHLIPKDNRHKAVLKELEQFRKTPFFNDFLHRYRADFHLNDVPFSKVLASPSVAPSKPEAGAGAESGAGTESELRERAAPSREDVSRGTEGNTGDARQSSAVIDCGSNLTRSAEDIHGEMLETWRHEEGINAAVFERWITHWEKSRGKAMGSQQRMLQARTLVRQGGPSAQLEVVEFCIEQDYRSLVPIGDIRARKQGLRNDTTAPAVTAEQREADEMHVVRMRRKGAWSHGISMADFREPNAGETAAQYRAALDREFHERLNRKITPARVSGGAT